MTSILITETPCDSWLDADGRRRTTYHAHVAGSPELWGRGRSWAAAVGDLVLSHKAAFGVTVNGKEGGGNQE